ncbi:MAG: hypothetical protein RH917_15645 [Lacipirellulaceae bacterium]
MKVSQSQPDESSPEPLLRFGLRQMLTVMAILSVLLALLVKTDGYWPGVIGMGALLIFAHVFGTVVGNRLSSTSRTPSVEDSQRPSFRDSQGQIVSSEVETTPLAYRDHVVRWKYIVTGIGGAVGTLLGAWGLATALGDEVTWPGLALGAVSCGVFGAWLAFMAYSFGSITRHAWRHANEGHKASQRKL